MENRFKQTYIPCEVNVTKFNVEREFANGSNGPSAVGAFANAANGWEMTRENPQDDFKNESYALDNVNIQWFD